MSNFCFLNGEIIEFEKAGLRLDDLGIVRGYGVFDYLITYHGRPFLLSEHIDRLFHSAQQLALTVPYAKEKISSIVDALLAKNRLAESQLKIVLTGGISPDGITAVKPTFYIYIYPRQPLPEDYFQTGTKVILHEHLRLFPEAKTINYLTAAFLQPQKKAANAIEIVYHWQGNVLEGATSNLFIFKNNALITPKRDILVGITRNFLLNLARAHFPVVERTVTRKELQTADECFITASNKEVLPVVKVDQWQIGDGKVGTNTKRLLSLYRAAAHKN